MDRVSPIASIKESTTISAISLSNFDRITTLLLKRYNDNQITNKKDWPKQRIWPFFRFLDMVNHYPKLKKIQSLLQKYYQII